MSHMFHVFFNVCLCLYYCSTMWDEICERNICLEQLVSYKCPFKFSSWESHDRWSTQNTNMIKTGALLASLNIEISWQCSESSCFVTAALWQLHVVYKFRNAHTRNRVKFCKQWANKLQRQKWHLPCFSSELFCSITSVYFCKKWQQCHFPLFPLSMMHEQMWLMTQACYD